VTLYNYDYLKKIADTKQFKNLVSKEEKNGFNPMEKKKLSVDNLEDWEEDGDNEENEKDESEVFYWSKPIHIKDDRYYV
jgi:hypothetical protein